MRFGLFLFILVLTGTSSAFAADMYSVNSGATVQINEHGVCQRITNSHGSGRPIMVPTRTATEWTTFRNNRPAGVAMAACPPACSGALVGGHCWYLGADGQSCTQVCASRGGLNLAATRDYAGSGGSNAACNSVMNSLGISGSVSTTCGSGATAGACGCWMRSGGIFGGEEPQIARCTVATTTAACGTGSVRRACACNN